MSRKILPFQTTYEFCWVPIRFIETFVKMLLDRNLDAFLFLSVEMKAILYCCEQPKFCIYLALYRSTFAMIVLVVKIIDQLYIIKKIKIKI